MAQNFLYMLEFVIDDLLITRPNCCAPEEYPTCVELSFRSSVFVSLCDRESGGTVDCCAGKCGKCCCFSLESPVTDKDRLLIHVYKKRNDKCKFLLGATDMPIKPLFDKVTESFNIENPMWMEQLANHTATLPDPRTPSKTTVIDNDCDNEMVGRREQLCPTSELTKRLLPLFNMKGRQTGNVVLIMRLVCNGPTIVTSFPFGKVCNANAMDCAAQNGECPPPCPPPCPPCSGCPEKPTRPGGPCKMPDPCPKKDDEKEVCRRYFACNADKGCVCEECIDDCTPKPKKKKCCPPPPCCPKRKSNDMSQGFASTNCASSSAGPGSPRGRQGGCSMPNPCQKADQEQSMPQRFFNECCCDECADECEAEEFCDEECSSCEPCMEPCFLTPAKPDPGPDAYDEFEACLNGSGLVIRVLKDTHQVESVNDGYSGNFQENADECASANKNNRPESQCDGLRQLLQRSPFARNHIKRLTAGSIMNHPKLPQIRANIKYSGNESCPDKYHVPFGKIKEHCEGQRNRVDMYRRKTGNDDECGGDCPPFPPLLPTDNRNCCVQVNQDDIKNALKGINVDTRKKGIEVCYKTCDDTDSDVFLVKLGSKRNSQFKQKQIEIELKTPKQPIILPKQKVTTETQITEAELDAALAGGKGKGKKGGKKGKKGKK